VLERQLEVLERLSGPFLLNLTTVIGLIGVAGMQRVLGDDLVRTKRSVVALESNSTLSFSVHLRLRGHYIYPWDLSDRLRFITLLPVINETALQTYDDDKLVRVQVRICQSVCLFRKNRNNYWGIFAEQCLVGIDVVVSVVELFFRNTHDAPQGRAHYVKIYDVIHKTGST